MTTTTHSLTTTMFDLTRAAVETLPGARALPVAPEWADKRSTLRDQPVQLLGWAWETSTLAWVRALVMDVGERTKIFAALAIPRAEYDLPLFGAEIFRINGTVTLLALDWVALFGDGPYFDSLRDIHPRYAHFPPLGEMSAWAKRWLSPYAIHARPQNAVGEDEVLHAFSAYLDAYIALCAQAAPQGDPHQTIATQRRFMKQYHAENPGHAFLSKLFSAEWAESYAREFLFRPGGE